jgi:uncharacterized protein (TIGR03083 family)
MARVEPDVVVVTQLFQPERASLLELLSSLAAEQWQTPTVCPGWSVKDVALHLLGDDIGLLSRRRDGFAPADASGEPGGFQELVAFLDRLNQTWVEAARRISPRLLCELLALTGEATWRHLASLDPLAVEGRVSWVGPDPVPNWLDVAREYTERWTHQQQIRDAVGVPGLKEPAFMAPVLATFVHALPRAFAGAPAPAGTTVEVAVGGQGGGCWVLTRTPGGWQLAAGTAAEPVARAALDAETAWRMWTKGIGPAAAEAGVSISGDHALGRRVLDAVAIIG